MKERHTGAVLLCCVLLSAGARGLSMHDGVSIQICKRYWHRGQGKETNQKKRVGISVSFFWGNRKTDFKSRFSVGKNREKPTGKNDFRFSVHNPGYSCYSTATGVSHSCGGWGFHYNWSRPCRTTRLRSGIISISCTNIPYILSHYNLVSNLLSSGPAEAAHVGGGAPVTPWYLYIPQIWYIPSSQNLLKE